MAHTNSTPNYNLPQFVGTDKPTWLGDVNGAMLAIDTAIAGVNATADGADSKADTAISTANTASTTATDAATLANTANTNAQSALTTAGNAATAAQAAGELAQTAKTTADGADTKATTNASNIGDLTTLTTTAKNNLVAAINEIDAKPAGGGTAADITYDNTTSGLTATDVQAAIDELKSLISARQYITTGLTTARANIIDGGYYVDTDSNIVYVDITLITTATASAGDGVITGFPEANAVNDTSPFNINTKFNELAICHSTGGSTYLGAQSAFNTTGVTIHYIGSYLMKTV